MPILTELAQLGKQALVAFVAQVLTESAALKIRVEELLTELAALKARVMQLLAENAALNADFRGGKPTDNRTVVGARIKGK